MDTETHVFSYLHKCRRILIILNLSTASRITPYLQGSWNTPYNNTLFKARSQNMKTGIVYIV